MRIRKHAKISPLLYNSSGLHGAVLQPHFCQLNQSPWDVPPFPFQEHDIHNNNNNNINQQALLGPPPPPPQAPPYFSYYQLDGYDSCAVNGTVYDSEQSITSMKVDDNREMKKMIFFDNNVADDVPAADSEDFEKDEKDEEIVDGDNVTTMCVKNDGKGWQCSREAKSGYNLCEHHFAQVKKHYSSNNSAEYSTITTTAVAAAANSYTKIKHIAATGEAETTPSSRGRPQRPKKYSSSEYYYYSGFGPSWGKKRGPSTGKKNNANAAATAAAEIEFSDSHGAQRSTSSQMDNEGIEYIEDEDDDDADIVENGKLIKGARKPIKARSLKSLL